MGGAYFRLREVKDKMTKNGQNDMVRSPAGARCSLSKIREMTEN